MTYTMGTTVATVAPLAAELLRSASLWMSAEDTALAARLAAGQPIVGGYGHKRLEYLDAIKLGRLAVKYGGCLHAAIVIEVQRALEAHALTCLALDLEDSEGSPGERAT
jgi:hypothetical protein